MNSMMVSALAESDSKDERTLDVGDFLLLLSVGLHLVDLVLRPGSDVGGIVTTVVDKLLLEGDVDHVGTDFVHEIGRVANGQLTASPQDRLLTYEVKI